MLGMTKPQKNNSTQNTCLFGSEIRCPHKIDSKNKTSIKHIYFLPVAIVCLLYQPYIYISKPDKILTRFHNAIIHHALSLNQTNDR